MRQTCTKYIYNWSTKRCTVSNFRFVIFKCHQIAFFLSTWFFITKELWKKASNSGQLWLVNDQQRLRWTVANFSSLDVRLEWAKNILWNQESWVQMKCCVEPRRGLFNKDISILLMKTCFLLWAIINVFEKDTKSKHEQYRIFMTNTNICHLKVWYAVLIY